MPRILTKGSRAGVEDDYADWSDEENLKHYSIAFYDLLDLENRKHEVVHPWFDFEDAVHFPSRNDVVQFLFGGNDLVIRLPKHQEVEFRGEDRDGNTEGYSCDFFEWLPFYVGLNDEEEGSDLIELRDGFEDWETCFTDDFEWEVTIQTIAQRSRYRSSPYSDPRPPPETSGLRAQPESLAAPRSSDYGPDTHVEVMAVENVGRTIAAEVTLSAEEDEETVHSEGSAYLIPSNSAKKFDEFTQDILVEVFGVDVEQVPEWLDDYQIPGEEDILSEIESLESQVSELEQQVERAEWFRQLLFANDEDYSDYGLEEPVREAFREMGLTVEGEKSGFRDGGIVLGDQTIILEVTGRKRGVKLGKVQKLERHVEDAEEEGYGQDRSGLLVYNPFRNEDPESRPLNPNNFREELEDRGFKFITSYQLYQMLCAYERGEIDTDDVVDELTGEDTIIQFSSSVGHGGDTLRGKIDSIRERLNRLL